MSTALKASPAALSASVMANRCERARTRIAIEPAGSSRRASCDTEDHAGGFELVLTFDEAVQRDHAAVAGLRGL